MSIMELVEEAWFWPAVTALVTLAALVGSGFSWAVATLIRWRTRPEPDWMFDLAGSAKAPGDIHQSGDPGYSVFGTLSNVGDGVAHSVRLRVSDGCKGIFLSGVRTKGTIPVIEKGSTQEIRIEIPLGSWDVATVVLEWVDPPTRLKKHRDLLLDFRSMMERPKVVEWNPETGEHIESEIE